MHGCRSTLEIIAALLDVNCVACVCVVSPIHNVHRASFVLHREMRASTSIEKKKNETMNFQSVGLQVNETFDTCSKQHSASCAQFVAHRQMVVCCSFCC